MRRVISKLDEFRKGIVDEYIFRSKMSFVGELDEDESKRIEWLISTIIEIDAAIAVLDKYERGHYEDISEREEISLEEFNERMEKKREKWIDGLVDEMEMRKDMERKHNEFVAARYDWLKKSGEGNSLNDKNNRDD